MFGILLPPLFRRAFLFELGAQFEVNANRAGFHSLAFHLDFGTHTILDLLKKVTKERLAGIFMVSFPHMEFTEEEVSFIANSSIPILYLSEFITPYPTLNCILFKKCRGRRRGGPASCRGRVPPSCLWVRPPPSTRLRRKGARGFWPRPPAWAFPTPRCSRSSSAAR